MLKGQEAAMGWVDQAKCLELSRQDREATFFPSEKDYKMVKVAKGICRGCPSRIPCLEDALTDPETPGIWGATTTSDRGFIRTLLLANGTSLSVLLGTQ